MTATPLVRPSQMRFFSRIDAISCLSKPASCGAYASLDLAAHVGDAAPDFDLVDQNGDPVNGTVLLGRYDDPMSARAVTIFGPTALIRQWRWGGSRWIR